MALQYNKKDASNCWEKGEYDATLIKVESGTSKSSGSPMETWTFKVYNPDGRNQLVSDYVVVPQCTFKIKQLAVALGRLQDFDAETFQAEDYINSDVTVELVIEESAGFDDKNKIRKVKVPVAPIQPPARPFTSVGAGGVSRPSRPAPAQQPFGDEQVHTDDSIPF